MLLLQHAADRFANVGTADVDFLRARLSVEKKRLLQASDEGCAIAIVNIHHVPIVHGGIVHGGTRKVCASESWLGLRQMRGRAFRHVNRAPTAPFLDDNPVLGPS
eukprot:320990-Rhodomonas_salina.2